MKVFAVVTVARQIDGEYVLVKPEKAFQKSSKAEAYAANLAKNYTEVIQTPHSAIECFCERGVFEIDVED